MFDLAKKTKKINKKGINTILKQGYNKNV